MFAFAIWDRAAEAHLRARPRREKPFYYALVGDSFIFASELKSLLAWPGFHETSTTPLWPISDARLCARPEVDLVGGEQASSRHWLEVELGAGVPA